jgi:hypothetical protein
VLRGEPLTAAEYRQIIDDIRKDRAATAAGGGKGKPKKKTVLEQKISNIDLSELFGPSGGSQ